MKKVLINLVILVATAINITGVMGQTAKNDPNAIGIYQMTPTQSMGQLDGSIKWEGNVTRDVTLTESVETLNRYNDQLDWGFAPVDKDYYVSSVLPKLKTGTLEPGMDDPLIGGKSGTNKVSMNNNPDFTKDDLFWYWDVRSFNHPSETYRVYLYRVVCNNPVEYFQKLEEVPLVNTVTKTDTVRDTFTVYQEKLVEVPVGTTTAAMPDIINNNYNTNNNYPSGSAGGYSEGGNYWSQQPSYDYGYGGQSCYPGCFLCSFLGYICPIHCHNSYGGFGGQTGCNYQQSCSASGTTGGTSVVINEGDTNVEVVVVEDDDEEDPDDGDGDGGPDVPDDDDDDDTGDTGGPDVPDDDDGKNPGKYANTDTGKPFMADNQIGKSTQAETRNPKTKPEMGEVGESIVKEGVKNPTMGASDLLVVQNPKGEVQHDGISPVAVNSVDIKSNPKGEDGVSVAPVVINTDSKGNTGKPVVVAPNPNGNKGNTVKSNTGDAVVVAPNVKTDPKGKVVNKGDADAVVVAPVVINTDSKGKVINNGDVVATEPVVSKGKVVKDNPKNNQSDNDNDNSSVASEDRKKSDFSGPTAENIDKGDKPKYDAPKERPKNNGESVVVQKKQQQGANQATNQSKSKSKVAKKKVG